MLNIKMVKPKPKQYKIAYASLNYSKKKKPKTVTRSVTVAKKEPKDKFDVIIDKAIAKGLLEESERDIKKSELQLLTSEDVKNYEQEVDDADAIEFLNQDIDVNNVKELSSQELMQGLDTVSMDDADEALKRIKASGPVIGDFSKVNFASDENDVNNAMSDDYPRSLADIKAERAFQRELQAAQANITADGTGGYTKGQSLETSLLDNSLEMLKRTASDVKNPMSNFKGITKPIVQHIKNTSDNPMSNMSSLFNEINWSMGHR